MEAVLPVTIVCCRPSIIIISPNFVVTLPGEIDFLLLFNPLPGPPSSSLLTSYHMYINSNMHRVFFPITPALSKGPSPSENKLQIQKS